VGEINSPTVFNSGFNATQFWDGHAATLEDQIDFPMMHTCEMVPHGMTSSPSLRQDADYLRDFAAIYPGGIDQPSVRNAIATLRNR